MPDYSYLEMTVDPLTGEVPLEVGADVIIEDELGQQHTGTVVSVSADRSYTVFLTCRDQEISVPERRVLARAHAGAMY